MRILHSLTAVAALTGAAAFIPAPVAAQAAPQEVRFPRGVTSVTLEGQASTAGRIYTFNARRGQWVTIHLSSRADDVSADLIQGHADVDATDQAGEMNSQIAATGRYTIHVYRRGSGRGTSFYSMALSIH